jgi:hypothetical protein
MPRGLKGEKRPADAMGKYVSKPLPVFTKLAAMLRNVPAVQFVFAKFAALLRSNKGSGEPAISEFLDAARSVTRNTVDQPAAVLKLSSDHAFAAPETNDQRFTSQHVELMTKRQDLCLQRRSRPEQSDQRQPDQAANISHQPKASPDSTSLASRIEFPTMTGDRDGDARARLQPHARDEHRRYQTAPRRDPGLRSVYCCARRVTVQVAQHGSRLRPD